jgi:protein-disulfide isomerase
MSKRQQIREQNRKSQQRQQTLIILILSGMALIIAGIFVIPRFLNPTDSGSVEIVHPSGPVPTQSQGLFMGDPNAPVKVVEYSDYLCSHCADFAQDLQPSIIEEYVNTGLVYFEYIPFSFMGPESFTAAEAAYCAADQNKFWEYHEYLFSNVTETPSAYSNALLQRYAEELNLDMDIFNECFNSGKYSQQLQDNLERGHAQGVAGTPTFFVNDRQAGMINLIQTIDDALANAPVQ